MLCGSSPLRSHLKHSLPLFKSTDSLLDQDDFVSNGLVPLDLQLHVVVVLMKRRAETKQQMKKDVDL